MKIKLIIAILFTIVIMFSCSTDKTDELDFLRGKWKIQDKEQFEVWEKIGKNKLKGYVYTLINEDTIVKEQLCLKYINGELVYTAEVFDQNDGKPISFIMNKDIKEYFSFENPDHDFPKKIQYEQLSDNKINIRVFDENDQGLSLFLQKISEN